MLSNFGNFTNAAPTLTGFAVGYDTAVSGGERRWTLQAIWDLFNTGPTISNVILTGNVNVANGDLVVGGAWAGWSALGGRGLYVQRDGVAAINMLSSGSTTGPTCTGSACGGTIASPTATPVDHGLAFSSVAYDGSSWFVSSRIQFLTAQLQASGARGSYIALSTIASNTTTLTERVRIGENGNLLVGTTDSSGLTGAGGLKLNSSTAATNTTAGALVVAGGVASGANSFFTNIAVTALNVGGVTTTGVTGTGKLVLDTAPTISSPTINGTASFTGVAGSIDVPSGDANISTSGGGTISVTGNLKLAGVVKDQNASTGTNGQVLKSDGTGKLSYANALGCYVLHLGGAGTATFTNNSTRYCGPTLIDVSALTNQGRYKTYFPNAGNIKSVQYLAYGSGGTGSQNLTWDLWLNNSTSIARTNFQANVFPMNNVVSNLSNAVTTSDYVELRINNPSAGSNVTGFTCAALIYVECPL